MKTSFAKVAGGLALLAVSSVAMASVVNTKHNLGSTNIASSNHTGGTTEICIFCHTPHGGDQTTTAPIWNRATGSANYIRFSSLGRLTFDAKEAPIGAVSAACLSCHDGTQSIDSVINSSGSDTIGMEDTSTANGGNGLWSQGRAMGNGSFANADGSWDGSLLPRGDMVFLGTDLSNDHPISMQYGGGGISSLALTANTNDPDFAQTTGAMDSTNTAIVATTGNPGGLVVTPAGYTSNAGFGDTTGAVNGSGTGLVVYQSVAGNPRWYVDTGTAGYQSTDFPLYTRTDVTGSGGILEPTVECGTCHDPHSGNPTFLRLSGGNTGSQVCLTCHAK